MEDYVMQYPPSPAATSLSRIRAAIHGRVVMPDDADFDEVRMVMNGEVDRRPAMIVRVTDVDDVSNTIALARETGLDLAVRSGGHSAAGHGSAEGGIVIDLRDMKALEMDLDARTAWAQTGLTAAELTGALAADGMAVGFGDTGSVGIGGITIGGGVGYLVRRDGLTIDSVLAAEIVTADGRLVRADTETNPDLFWAIRGGGGNFGVVTRFQFRLHEVGQIVGGLLVLPATADTIAGFIAAAEAAPDELSTIANIMPAPPMPFLPESAHGQLVILGMLAHAGDPEAGQRAVAPFRTLATPLADLVRPMAYPELYPPENPSYRPTTVARTMFLETVDRGVAETVLEHLRTSDAPMRVAQLRVLGGAMARVPDDATAFAHRSRRIMVNLASFYDGAEDRDRRIAWLDGFTAALRQGDDAAYVNFIGDEGELRVRAAYPGATWDRLARVKARYDPANLFHLNQNVPPAAGAHQP